jgi:D-serine deaminase-like pyridoxal phosphate-dependent protein
MISERDRAAENAVGGPIEALDTPALLLDLDLLEGNIATMAEYFVGRPAHLRPHAKTPRCPEVALLQIAAGAHGITCAKVSMAEAMVDGGVDDVYIANEIVTPHKLRRLARLARRAKVSVAVDQVKNVHDLDAAAGREGVEIDVLVEIDAGMGRAGAAPGNDTVELAAVISRAKNLHFAGLHVYEGHVVQHPDATFRRLETERMLERALDTADRVRRAGMDVTTVTCGGTGTYRISGCYPGVTEHQAGSYAFMDPNYKRLVPEFDLALSVLATVISRPRPERVVTDAGMQVLAGDRGVPEVKNFPELDQDGILSEEHTTFTVKAGEQTDLTVGDQIQLYPAHCDSATNLHDRVFAVRGNRVEAVWTVAARGASQ